MVRRYFTLLFTLSTILSLEDWVIAQERIRIAWAGARGGGLRVYQATLQKIAGWTREVEILPGTATVPFVAPAVRATRMSAAFLRGRVAGQFASICDSAFYRGWLSLAE